MGVESWLKPDQIRTHPTLATCSAAALKSLNLRTLIKALEVGRWDGWVVGFVAGGRCD
jgi:hypothetical protein